jgi:superfamily II DNA/RNA helicase
MVEEESKIIVKTGEEEEEFTSNYSESTERFEDLPLKPALLSAILEQHTKPTPLQKLAILPILKRKNCIFQAGKGTGKTGTFAIPILELLTPASPPPAFTLPEAIIMNPFPEHIAFIEEQLTLFSKNMEGIKIGILEHGGKCTQEAGAHVLIGTPDEVLLFLKKGEERNKDVKILVLDEADDLLSFKVRKDAIDLVKLMPSGVCFVMIAKAMFQEILDWTKDFVSDPVKISVKDILH